MELMQASHNWASRPDEQRFTSLVALNEHMQNVRHCSMETNSLIGDMRAVSPVEDPKALMIVGKAGKPANISNHAFRQLTIMAGAPAGYLASLPGNIAADALNFGLMDKLSDAAEAGLLLTKFDGDEMAEIRAVTSPKYGRVWNHEVSRALVNRFGDGLTGDFKVPGEFGKAVKVTKANTTIYGSDKDMFVFLADEDHRIEVQNRRNGESGTLSRGFFVWNSEVGAQTLGVATFLFDYVCCNRIVWGAQEYKEIRLRHTLTAPDRWIEEIQPMLSSFAQSAASKTEGLLAIAQQTKVSDEDLQPMLTKLDKVTFTGKMIEAVKKTHQDEEGRPIETLWDVSTGITAFAKSIQHQDNRVAMERLGGKVLDLVAA